MHRSEKHQIYTAGLILSACVLFAVAGWITYQVGTVYETMPTPADLIIQNFFFSLRGPVQNVIVCALTHLSDTMTIVLFCLILLLLPNRKTYGLPVSLACLGGVAVYKPMKHLVLRARPDEVFHLVTQGGYSFPERAFGNIHRFLRAAALFDSKALSKPKAQNRAQLGLRNFGNRNRTEPRLRRRALADGCAGRLVHRWRRAAYRDSDFTKARTPQCDARLTPGVKVCAKIPDRRTKSG